MGWIKGKPKGKKLSEYIILPPKRKKTGWDMFSTWIDCPERDARIKRIKEQLKRENGL